MTCQNSPVSYQTLAKKTSIGSHNTVKEYISILESCFALKTLNAININTGSFHYKKDKKFYFTDPIIFQLALYLSGKKSVENYNSTLAELTAHEFLSRKHRRFGYLNQDSGEVDFILPGEWAREVKWTDVPKNLSKAYLNLKMPDKKVWLKSNFFED